ncbi:MAG: lysophospholipid acyltransferase family protein [Selenomonas sp.]|jgi:KDO2-lipid IV(A) lauroyltransferase|uniref:lysophospholipid acyltransferase family protein n=1 Tax=Selenomonas sp. AE3005 TaxID=1485543 RepID=UPI000489126E|nr:lysophospholipid acyltransferase family protein [Selenomonas sp. AE3005]MBQ1919443.1 lysophospholipid acyltransferase family protein [Selenomonas sp.]MBQ5420244.1 lysophospholipid acyltransferase family protein [Selenomonas sp.]MBQ5503190.1 lysophospholipid acyltransferase family protein [Selenomonas sp.]
MQYKFVMFMSWLVCHTPYKLVMGAGWVLGQLYYLLIKKQRERAVAQVMPALGLTEPEARRLIRASFVNLARNVLEILYMPKLNEQNFHKYIEIDHLERMTDALAEGNGVVVLTGHIGTWEWLSAAFTMNGLPVTAIAKNQPNMQYTNALNDLRKTINVEIFSRGTSELLAAAKALKKGKILGFLADQDAGPKGAFLPFLGKMASTPMGPAVFACKFNAPVLPAFILRQPNGRHKVVIGEVMRYEDTGDTDKDLFNFTAKMTAIMEKVIRENPTQWLWFQKRWNTSLEQQKTGTHHIVKSQEDA